MAWTPEFAETSLRALKKLDRQVSICAICDDVLTIDAVDVDRRSEIYCA